MLFHSQASLLVFLPITLGLDYDFAKDLGETAVPADCHLAHCLRLVGHPVRARVSGRALARLRVDDPVHRRSETVNLSVSSGEDRLC